MIKLRPIYQCGSTHAEMHVTWQTAWDGYESTSLEWREEGAPTWNTLSGSNSLHPYTEEGNQWGYERRRIHRVTLSGLVGDTVYDVRFNGTDVSAFKTMPSSVSARKVKVVFCGDLHPNVARPLTRQMLGIIGKYHPDLVHLGGDIAGCDGLGGSLPLWDFLWDSYLDGLTVDGVVVPCTAAIGNHDSLVYYSDNKANAPYFYAYFVTPDAHAGAYQQHRFGDYLSLTIVDTEHTSGSLSTDHPQRLWLESVLSSDTSFRHRLVAGHVAWYAPSRQYTNAIATRLRAHIGNVISDHGIRFAFVQHDHVFSKTLPLRGNQVDTLNGTVYFGGGTQGGTMRNLLYDPPIDPSKGSDYQAIYNAFGEDGFLEKWSGLIDGEVRPRAFYVAELGTATMRVTAIGSDGAAFSEDRTGYGLGEMQGARLLHDGSSWVSASDYVHSDGQWIEVVNA